MPLVYRLETTEGRGPFQIGAVRDVSFEVFGFGSRLFDTMTPGWKVPGFEFREDDDLVFGFRTIKQYERWTENREVRKAFAEWEDSSYGTPLRFAVYKVPEIIGKTHDQVIFEKPSAKLVEARSPATPRKRELRKERRNEQPPRRHPKRSPADQQGRPALA